MELTSKNVEEVFKECLYGEKFDPEVSISDDAVLVEGVVRNFAFNKNKLEEKRDDISSMLHQLPKEFMKETGGGWSFLQACQRADGEQWTGMHVIMEQLFSIGIGLGIVQSLLPREMWSMLPGSVPYYVVTD